MLTPHPPPPTLDAHPREVHRRNADPNAAGGWHVNSKRLHCYGTVFANIKRCSSLSNLFWSLLIRLEPNPNLFWSLLIRAQTYSLLKSFKKKRYLPQLMNERVSHLRIVPSVRRDAQTSASRSHTSVHTLRCVLKSDEQRVTETSSE